MNPTKIYEYREYFKNISVSAEEIKKYGDLRCLKTWKQAYTDYCRPAVKEQAEFLEQCYIKSPPAEMAIATPVKNFRPPFPKPPAPVTPVEPEPEDSRKDDLTPEQLNQKRLIKQSWGERAAENYHNLIGSSGHGSISSRESQGNGKTQHKTGKKKGRGISFAYTLPQLLAGLKSVTRRKWSDKYAQSMIKGWAEKFHPALTRACCFGGESVGVIELTEPPY